MKAKVEFDYPTIEGMIYKDTILVCEESDYNSRVHDEKIKGKLETGRIVWVPKKMLKKM
jgi:hypothetical protein|tara:strand:- start:356 stop:532 length:177 start_codon:yes stop_codon:yes gene_type:complete